MAVMKVKLLFPVLAAIALAAVLVLPTASCEPRRRGSGRGGKTVTTRNNDYDDHDNRHGKLSNGTGLARNGKCKEMII